MNKKTSIFLSVFIFLFAAFPALAQSTEVDYVLGKDASVENNLYKAGRNLIVSGEIKGDLIAAGQNINITGKIGKDAAIAGQNINLMGEIGEDARLAGTTIILGSNIKGDAIIFGAEVHVLANNNLDGDIFIGGGNVVIDGNINGKAKIFGGKVVINGHVAQDATIVADQELVIGSNAVIDGKIEYKSSKEAVIVSGAKINKEMSFQKIEVGGRKAQKSIAFLAVFTTFWFIKLLMIFAAALVLYLLFGKWTKNFVNSAISNFGREAVRGFVLLIIIPVAVVILLITIIGIIPGIFGILSYVSFIILASILASIVLGSLVYKYLSENKEYIVDWKTILVGVVLMQLIQLIPFAGWIICFVLFLVCLGSLYYSAYQCFWLGR
jgi:cytoskeletal protein CcmA (bactofilin family)